MRMQEIGTDQEEELDFSKLKDDNLYKHPPTKFDDF